MLTTSSAFAIGCSSLAARASISYVSLAWVARIYPSKQLERLRLYFQMLCVNRLQHDLSRFTKANADGVLLASTNLRAMAEHELELSPITVSPPHY